MRLYKNFKKGILMTAAASLAAGSVLSLSGCGDDKEDPDSYAAKEENQSGDEAAEKTKAMGRYLESDVTLPGDCERAEGIEFLEDGTMRFCYRNSDNEMLYADSKDNGDTWNDGVSLSELFQADPDNADITVIKPAKDGGFFAGVTEYSQENPGEYFSHYYYADAQGKVREMNLDALGENLYIWDCEFTGKNTILLRTMKDIAEVSLEDDHVAAEYEEGEGAEYMGLVDHYLLAVVNGSLHYYDIETGRPMEDEEPFTKQFSSNEKNLYRNITSIYPALFLAGDEKDSLFYVDDSGIYRYAFGGSVVEQIVDGGLNSINSPDTGLLDMAKDSQGRFYLVVRDYSSGDEKPRILRYEYSKDVSTVPDTELTVYSLKENSFMRQAAAVFQKKYPDIYLNLETGMTGDDAITTTDALKNLNTEIMAGKGPDVVILDGVPEDTYVEKGMLEDLSGILTKVQETDGILENIMKPYQKEDGSIYSMPLKFAVPMVVGYQEDIDKIKDLTTLADVVEAHQEEYEIMARMPMNQVYTPELLLAELADVCAGAWMKKDGTLDEAAVSEFLTQANRMYQPTREMVESALGEDQTTYYYEYREMKTGVGSGSTSVLTGNMVLALGGLYSASDISCLYSVEKYDDSIKGKIWNGQEENCFIPIQTIGISAKADEKDAAEKFVEFLFGEEGQAIGSEEGIPVNKKVFHDADYWKKGEPDEVLWVTTHSYNDGSRPETTFECKQQTEEYTEQILALCEKLDKPSGVNEFILSAITDAGAKYLKGDCSLDDAVKEVVQEVNLYLSE